MTTSHADMQALVGRRVTVTLDEHAMPPVTKTGILVAVEDDGGFTLDTPEGRRYGWPAVDIVEAVGVTP